MLLICIQILQVLLAVKRNYLTRYPVLLYALKERLFF